MMKLDVTKRKADIKKQWQEARPLSAANEHTTATDIDRAARLLLDYAGWLIRN